MVTAIGCGCGGFTPEEIAPMFKRAVNVDNIFLPEVFWRYII
jgi:O-acetyl-ADP-ribose deacetylase (regulator of RNase III)